MAEKPFKNPVDALNVLDAVGPSFFATGPPQCFAPLDAVGPSFFATGPPLVAQAAQVACGQPERVRSTLHDTGDS